MGNKKTKAKQYTPPTTQEHIHKNIHKCPGYFISLSKKILVYSWVNHWIIWICSLCPTGIHILLNLFCFNKPNVTHKRKILIVNINALLHIIKIWYIIIRNIIKSWFRLNLKILIGLRIRLKLNFVTKCKSNCRKCLTYWKDFS